MSVARLFREIPVRFGFMVATLPGREPEDTESSPRRAVEASRRLAADLADSVEAAGGDGRLLVVGNSYGALLAFETVRALQSLDANRFGPDKLRLIVSGFRSPALPPAEGAVHRLPLQDLVAELSARYGCPPAELQAAADAGLETALRADLEACSTYRFGTGPLHAQRIDVLHMRCDPSLTYSELRAWQDVTTGPVVITSMELGHFPWSADPQAVSDRIVSLAESSLP